MRGTVVKRLARQAREIAVREKRKHETKAIYRQLKREYKRGRRG